MEEKLSWRESFHMTMRIWRMWWKVRPQIFISMFLNALVKGVTPYSTIYFSARIIEELSQGRDPQVLTQWVVFLLGTTTALLLLGGAFTRWNEMELKLAGQQNEKFYMDKMMELDYSILQKQETYDLYSQLRQNANWAGWGSLHVLTTLSVAVGAAIQITTGLVLSVGLVFQKVPQDHVLSFLNHPLCLLGVVLVMVATALLAPACANRSNAYWSACVQDALLGNRIFTAYGYDAITAKRALDTRLYEQRKVGAYYFEKYNAFGTKSPLARKGWGPMGLWMAASEGVSAILTGVVYLYVCLKSWAGAFGVGGITQYVGAVTTLFVGVSQLLRSMGMIRLNAVYLKTNIQLLDEENQMYQGTLTTEKRSDRNYQVEFRDVSFRYPDSEAWALRHVNLKFQVGSRLAVVGENGSGKSTFIKLLCRLYDPTEGEILLNGIDIRKYQYPDYIALFSVVFQDFHLLALPVGQNVAGRTQYDRERVTKCLTQAGIMDRVEKMDQGLDTYLYKDLEKKGVEVSGGEAQKIAIARALYKDAPFIILDEPTAALDPIAEAEVYSKFDQIAGDKTAVYISHRLSSCKFCDDIVVFDHGHIVQQGSHQHLVEAEGMYAQLWQAQAQYYQKQEQ